MPALEKSIVDDLGLRLNRYLAQKGGFHEATYLSAGGSAAIFKATGPNGPRAFKVFDPRFFDGESGLAERRRLDVQRRLIGHTCKSLIETYAVEEAEGTAILEMEFVRWPDLNNVIAQVPDNKVVSLIKQLVVAVRFLDEQEIVHRDIKPENIKISENFESLKLLDLGVARDIEGPDELDAAITDHNNKRPFLATAQYSSPEYLFRLDEPSARLWKGLNFYQIGAVMHDLIMKVPLFSQEMEAGNRWLVSKAVLTKVPSFFDADASRLRELKALAARCLVKDLELRLQIVGWEDFELDTRNDPLNALKGRLVKGSMNIGRDSEAAALARLDFERNTFAKTFTDRVRGELISACGTNLPITLSVSNDKRNYTFLFLPPQEVIIKCRVSIKWEEGVHARVARLCLSAMAYYGGDGTGEEIPDEISVCAVSMDATDDVALEALTAEIAKAVGAGLDFIDSGDDIKSVHRKNLIS